MSNVLSNTFIKRYIKSIIEIINDFSSIYFLTNRLRKTLKTSKYLKASLGLVLELGIIKMCKHLRTCFRLGTSLKHGNSNSFTI